MEARHSTALQLACLFEQSIETSTLRGQHSTARMSPLPSTHPKIPSGTVENHIPLLPFMNTSNVFPLRHIDIFVNCNWVNTRWQWYSTHNQYIGQHK